MIAPGLPDLAGFRSALIVKPSSLGDIVHTLPAVQAIHAAYPHLKLRWLANPEWLPLLEGASWLSDTVIFPRKQFRGLAGLKRFWRWSREWRQMERETPEIVLDFQGLLRSGVTARLRGSRPVVGLSDAREGARFFHDYRVTVDADAHAVDRYLTLPRAFGIETQSVTFALPEGTRPAGWPECEDAIVIHPWSRGAGKSLEPEVLQALCDRLAPLPLVLVGLSPDTMRPRGDHITDLSHRTTLTELIWVLRRARWVISVDSGPMHMAAAVNDRTLALHTWSNPFQVGPYNSKAWVWKAGRIAHRPEFTAAEAATETNISVEAAREIGSWLRAQQES
jgi:heptosyltransferase-1